MSNITSNQSQQRSELNASKCATFHTAKPLAAIRTKEPMRNIIFFILINLLVSCQINYTSHDSIDEQKLENIFVGQTRHLIDTIFKSMIEKVYADSIYRLTYTNFNQNDTFNQSFELPISNSLNTYYHLHDTSEGRLILLDNKLIRYNSKD